MRAQLEKDIKTRIRIAQAMQAQNKEAEKIAMKQKRVADRVQELRNQGVPYTFDGHGELQRVRSPDLKSLVPTGLKGRVQRVKTARHGRGPIRATRRMSRESTESKSDKQLMIARDSADEVESFGVMSDLNETHLKQGVTLTLDGKRITKRQEHHHPHLLSSTAAVTAQAPHLLTATSPTTLDS